MLLKLKQGLLAWSPNHPRIFSRFSSSSGTLKPFIPSSFTCATTRFNATGCTSYARYVCKCNGSQQEMLFAVDSKVLFFMRWRFPCWISVAGLAANWVLGESWNLCYLSPVNLEMNLDMSKFCSLSDLRAVMSCLLGFILLHGRLRYSFFFGPGIVLLAFDFLCSWSGWTVD